MIKRFTEGVTLCHKRVLNNTRNPNDEKLGLNWEDTITSVMKWDLAFAKFKLFMCKN